jgi:hypothetical protein
MNSTHSAWVSGWVRTIEPVAWFLAWFPHHLGGWEIIVQNIANFLVKADVELSAFCPKAFGNYASPSRHGIEDYHSEPLRANRQFLSQISVFLCA